MTRGHCAECGRSISYENEKRPGEIDVTLNSLTDRDGPTLRAHIWTEDKRPWQKISGDLPIYEKSIA